MIGLWLFVVLLLLESRPAAGTDWSVCPPLQPRREEGFLTLDGVHGLLTMTRPTINASQTIAITSRLGRSSGNMSLGSSSYLLEKREWWTAVSWPVFPHLELTFNHLSTERTTSPHVRQMSGTMNPTSFGFAYTLPRADFCFGGAFAAMSDAELDRADLSQIEHLRHVFLSVTEDLATDTYGYFQIKYAFTRNRLVDANGVVRPSSTNRFIVYGLGVELRPEGPVSLFGEAQWFDCGDLPVQGGQRYTFNAGLRLRSKGFMTEFSGSGLTHSPLLSVGVSAAL